MILVIGCGFVGDAVASSLESQGRDVTRIDPKYNDNKIEDYKDALGAVVCVPTPTVNGVCDDSIVQQVIAELGDMRIMLKCTVPPDMLKQYPSNVVYNPEFLKAKSAKEDFEKQETFILGGSKQLE